MKIKKYKGIKLKKFKKIWKKKLSKKFREYTITKNNDVYMPQFLAYSPYVALELVIKNKKIEKILITGWKKWKK